jgi:hypothetical protein
MVLETEKSESTDNICQGLSGCLVITWQKTEGKDRIRERARKG